MHDLEEVWNARHHALYYFNNRRYLQEDDFTMGGQVEGHHFYSFFVYPQTILIIKLHSGNSNTNNGL